MDEVPRFTEYEAALGERRNELAAFGTRGQMEFERMPFTRREARFDEGKHRPFIGTRRACAFVATTARI